MELVWGVCYAVLKDGSLIVDQYIRNDSLERRRKRLTNIVSRTTAVFKTDHSVCCFFFFFLLLSGLFCCVLVPGTLAFHLLHTLIYCDCLVYSVSQSVTT